MNTILHFIGNVAVWVAYAAACTFCVFYALLARWRESAEGWHLMTFTAVIAFAFGWVALRLVIDPAPAARVSIELPRALLFAGFAGSLVWRLLLLLRAQLPPCRRNRGEKP